jgi:hypothetical protein
MPLHVLFPQSFSIRGNQILISSCSLLVSGCAVLYSICNCFSCNLVSIAFRIFYTGGYALILWTDFFLYLGWHIPQISQNCYQNLNFYLYFLMSYGCHRQTDRHTHTYTKFYYVDDIGGQELCGLYRAVPLASWGECFSRLMYLCLLCFSLKEDS